MPTTMPLPSPAIDDDAPAPRGGGLARACRYAYRVPMLLWHLFVHLPLTMLAITPLTASIDLGGERLDHRLIRAWSAGMMHVFGFRLRRIGTPMPGATMFVANHVSWVDIVLLHSQRMMGFVAKREIAGWPVVGWLAGRGETIFHQRGSQESLGGVLHEMLARLRAGRSVGVFPDGRTRDGREVGPFHARIFLAAVEAGVAVQPVALRYGENASAQAVVAFGAKENFMQNFLRLLGEPARVAEVVFLDPIAPGDAAGRRRIAETARERIVAAMRAQ
jgi:1-acyl-sn-glycerol-3-phosphate acyltransferase